MKETENQSQSSDRGHHAFTRRLGSFSSATLISRILGYVRDAMVASYFGGGFQTDAFYAAFKIPNLLRRFLGEGALTAAFVPVFSDVLAKKGREEANRFLNSLLAGLALLLAGVVIFGMVFAAPITTFVAWGFTQTPEKFALAVDLTRLIWPFLLLVSLAAVVTAVLNASGRFFVPAVAPAGLSVGEIAFIVLLASRSDSPIRGLAIAAVAGGAIHLLIQLPSLYQAGYHLKLVQPFHHPEVRRVFWLMVPTIVGLGTDQINSFVDQFCASFLPDGCITALYNSNRVMQMPLALFGVAVASVSLPALSKATAEADIPEFKRLLSFSIRIANFVLIPSVVGLIAVGHPIIVALFQRGRFTATNSALTYSALVPYALGLPAYSMTRIFATAFYARKNTTTPVKISFYAMLLNAVLNVALMWKFSVAGLAFATTIAAWVHAVALFWCLRRETGPIAGKQMARSFVWASVNGLLMGAAAAGVAFGILRHAPSVIQVAASVSAGVAIYFLGARLFRIKELGFFLAALKRRPV